MSGMRFAVIADDLTGAADSGVQLSRSGYRTAVFFQGEPANGAGLDAVVVDTDSRALSPEVARERVLKAGDAVGGAGLVYKKVDSTLRGNLRSEIEAAMRSTGRERAVVAPAFPGGGRTTVDGTQLVHGEPVHRTELASDPTTPVQEGHIPSLLSGLEPIRMLGTDQPRDPLLVSRTLENARCVIADATEDAHLRALVEAVPDPSGVLWVGSAGLTLALGGIYPGGGGPVPLGISVGNVGNVLVVVGSLNRVSREQLRALVEEAGVPGVGLRGAADAPDSGGVEVQAAISEASQALESGESVALYSVSEARGITPESVAEGLAEVVAGLDPGAFGALVLTGGDTALAVARRLGATGIELLGEVEAGVPLGRLVGPRPYPVVTKAGGFGSRNTLSRALKTLTRVTRDSEER